MPAKQPQRPVAPQGTAAPEGNGGSSAHQTNPGAEQTARENINEIREILFGDEMRWHERRFAQLEDRLLQETAAIKQEQTRRFDALDQQLATEIKTLNKRLEELAGQVKRDGEQFQQKLETEKKRLAEDISARHAELTTVFRQEIARLAQEKTDRQSLAEMFHQLGSELQSAKGAKTGGDRGEA